MPKSATDTMREIIVSATLDAIVSLKDAARGVPNALLRDLAAIHANVAPADLPEPLQKAIDESVRQAFARLLKEGYAITPVERGPRGPRPASDPPRPAGTQIRRGPPRGSPSKRPPLKRG